jgi:RimJ/RimL family protein N-acetyltransferase
VLIRPIRPDDKCMLETGLRQLSRESVQRRFLAPKTRFSRAELRYLTEVDGHDHAALVAEYPGDPARRLIAVARFVRLHDDPSAAEVAIVVADDWQRRGLGSLLAARLAARARRAGIRRFTATMASDNVPAHRLMEKLTSRLEGQRPQAAGSAGSARFRHSGGGLDEVVLELAA